MDIYKHKYYKYKEKYLNLYKSIYGGVNSDFYDYVLNIKIIKGKTFLQLTLSNNTIEQTTHRYYVDENYLKTYTTDFIVDEMANDILTSKLYDMSRIHSKMLKQYNEKKLKFFHLCSENRRLDNTLTENIIDYERISETLTDEILNRIILHNNDNTVIFIDTYATYIDSFSQHTIISTYLLNSINNKTINKKNIIIVRLDFDTNICIPNYIYFHKIINIRIGFEGQNEYTKIVIPYASPYASLNATILYINRESIKDKQLLTHWIMPLISTPKVLYNRLIQISATCYLNTVLHSLLFADNLKDAIKNRIETQCSSSGSNLCTVQYKHFRDETIKDPKILLFSLFKNHFDGIKPNKEDDILIYLAALLKEDVVDELSNIKSNNNITQPKYTLCKASNDNSFKNNLCNYNKEMATKLSAACNYINGTSICGTYHSESNETKGFIYGHFGNYTTIFKVLNLIYEPSGFIFDINIKYILNYDSKKSIYILISKDDSNTEGLFLRTAYIITHNNTHAIVGIKHNSDQYVYNSETNMWEYEEWDKLPFSPFTGYMKNYNAYGSIVYKIYSSEPFEIKS